MGWVVADAGRWRPGLIVLVTFLLALAVVAEMAAVGGILGAISRLEREDAWMFAGQEWSPRQVLTAAAIGGAALLFTSAGAGYLGRRLKIRLRVAYQGSIAKRVRAVLAEDPERLESLGLSSVKQTAERGWVDARGTARVLALLLDAIVPAVALVALLPLAVWMEPTLASVLAAIIAVAGIGLWIVNVQGSSQSELMRELKPNAARAYSEDLSAAQTGTPPKESSPDLVKHADAFENRLVAVVRGTLIGDLALALAVSSAVYALGRRILQDDAAWSGLLSYLVVLRYTMVMFRSVVVRLTSASRFFHQAERVREVLSTAAPTPRWPRHEGTPVGPIQDPSTDDISDELDDD